jgi:hypothetical protein
MFFPNAGFITVAETAKSLKYQFALPDSCAEFSRTGGSGSN